MLADVKRPKLFKWFKFRARKFYCIIFIKLLSFWITVIRPLHSNLDVLSSEYIGQENTVAGFQKIAD